MDIYREVGLYDKVRIIGGDYNGQTGKVTYISGGMCSVQLDSDLEDVVVPVSYCEAIND